MATSTDIGAFIRGVTELLCDSMGDFGFTPEMANVHVTNHIERVIQHYKAQKTTSFERNAREAAWSVMFAVVSDMQKKERYGS